MTDRPLDLKEIADRATRYLQALSAAIREWFAALDQDQQRFIKRGVAVLGTAAGLETLRRAYMPKKVFHSFHYERDVQRVSQVRNMGVIEGQPVLSSNEWEDVKKRGESGIQTWIDEQMKGKSCVVVLIGSHTAGRKWVNYEILKGWNSGKGVVGVHIHRLKNLNGDQDSKGANPFGTFTVGTNKRSLSSVVKTYDPPFTDSQQVYAHMKNNLSDWVDEAIRIRNNFTG